MKTVLYFGIFDKDFSRNKVYADGLKQHGIAVLYCIDKSRGPIKFIKLFFKLWGFRGQYDAVIVGYPGYIVVPFARLFSILISVFTFSKQKPILFDALCSFYESQIISRDAYQGNPFRFLYVRTVDWLSTRSADKILLETQAQKDYFIGNLGVPEEKCIVVYTGVDETVFIRDSQLQKNETFTVLFRGRITKEAGVTTILKAAKILEEKGIDFLIVGFGWGSAIKEFNETMTSLKLKNLTHKKEQLPYSELIPLISKCHVSLGQFSTNERLKRTIPHKAFEALTMKIPYITARGGAVSEIFQDGFNCIMTNPDDAKDLAEKILMVRDNSQMAESITENGFKIFKERFTAAKIVEPIIKNI